MQVYPRVCGGTEVKKVDIFVTAGLSPRVRGNPGHAPPRTAPSRSIPACAGEPSVIGRMSAGLWVYPRVCGGTSLGDWAVEINRGLSPRVRGNLSSHYPAGAIPRSIPACAGEPRIVTSPPAGGRVYPRVCGGTFGTWPIAKAMRGLSPRVRGNHIWVTPTIARWRSIPACAGEPS